MVAQHAFGLTLLALSACLRRAGHSVFVEKEKNGMKIAMVSRNHPMRESAESCARAVFRDRYRAEIEEFPDLLIASCTTSGGVIAVAGLRTATTGFFSERYLPAPIESVLSRVASVPVDRSTVIEFTSFASLHPKAAMVLMGTLRVLVPHWGFQWSFFTATARLRRLLSLESIPMTVLTRADPARLVDAGRWGTYYDTDPVVCAVSRAQLMELANLPASSFELVA
jgi:hypothetical protein